MRLLLFIITTCTLSWSIQAQDRDWIQDDNFRACLQTIDAGLFDVYDSLIVSNATARTENILCNEQNISSIQGIEHFTSIKEVSFKRNQISSIAPLVGIDLVSINCDSNQLSTLPNLSEFPNLYTLHCANNNLTSLEGIEETTLHNLDCSYNNITQLDSIQNLPLAWFLCSRNQLQSLPSLANFPDLYVFAAWGNELTQIQGLASAINLNAILIGENKLTGTVNLSTLSVLDRASLGDNELDSVIIGNQPLLEELLLHRNNITYLEGLSGASALHTFRADENQLLLTDIDQLIDHPNFDSSFDFRNQSRSSPQIEVMNVSVDSLFVLPILSRDTSANATFRWYRNGTEISTNANFEFTESTPSDSTYYEAVIQGNRPETDTIIYVVGRYVIQAADNSCHDTLESIHFSYDIANCTEGYTLIFDDIDWGAQPLSISLESQSGQVITSNSMTIKNIKELNYAITVSDANACKLAITNPITLPIPDCDQEELVFTPNGDGDHDFLHFGEIGTARIFDVSGNLVSELSIPGNWEGFDLTGSILPDGYYIVVINESEENYLVALKK